MQRAISILVVVAASPLILAAFAAFGALAALGGVVRVVADLWRNG